MGAQDYSEMPGYPKESYALGELTATRKLLCTWDDRHAVYLGFIPSIGVGAAYVYGGAIQTPARAISGNIEPFEAEILGGSVDPPRTDIDAAYTDAIVTIVFKTPGAGAHVPVESPLVPTDLISERIEPLNEFRRLDFTLFKWSPSGDALEGPGEAPSKQENGFAWAFTRHKVLLPVGFDLITLANSVNKFEVISPTLGLTFPPETLLFLTPGIARLDGSHARFGFKFAFRKGADSGGAVFGWNSAWRSKTQSYERFQLIDGSPYNNFPLVNFASLFTL